MNNISKIEKEIFEAPTYRFHTRELARETKLNPNTIINLIPRLNKKGIIKREKIKHMVEIYANIEGKQFLRHKRLFNIQQLYDSGLVDFLMSQYNNPEAIVVMGSYSRGEDVEKSDIDIVVITNKTNILDMEKYGKILRRKIHLLPLEYKKITKEFYKNLVNGVILYGFLR